MSSLTSAFNHQTRKERPPVDHGWSLFWMAFWAMAIDDDRQEAEKERERRIEEERQRVLLRKRAGPRPF
jgi:hypothetical protein